jgi:ParB/RepB/Spo0J family partition protein
MAEDLETVQRIPLGDLHAADDNIRREVGDVSELAASIQSVGILEPLLVSPNAGGYVVVAGARRLAAAKAAGLTEVPAIVREVTDAERVEIGLIENCQRAGLECLVASGIASDATFRSPEETGSPKGFRSVRRVRVHPTYRCVLPF